MMVNLPGEYDHWQRAIGVSKIRNPALSSMGRVCVRGLGEKDPHVGIFAMVSAIIVVDNENLVFTCAAPCPGLTFPPLTAR